MQTHVSHNIDIWMFENVFKCIITVIERATDYSKGTSSTCYSYFKALGLRQGDKMDYLDVEVMSCPIPDVFLSILHVSLALFWFHPLVSFLLPSPKLSESEILNAFRNFHTQLLKWHNKIIMCREREIKEQHLELWPKPVSAHALMWVSWVWIQPIRFSDCFHSSPLPHLLSFLQL